MKIGVIGAGFVGSAVINAFSKCEIIVVDPAQSLRTIQDMLEQKPYAVFVCVPTPSGIDGAVDAGILTEVLDQLPSHMIIIVKSTVTPEHLINREQRIVYNPEFLSQRAAKDDFINADSLIFGGNKHDCVSVAAFYWAHSTVRKCPVFITDIATACLVKYTLNCHFAAKVTFMNEIHALHKEMAGSSWEEFTEIMSYDSRLGPTHLQVPGPDGHYGFGGACFPKDSMALLKFARDHGVELTILNQAVETNEILRDE